MSPVVVLARSDDPEIIDIDGDTSIEEGDKEKFTIEFEDDETGDIEITVDWDDGEDSEKTVRVTRDREKSVTFTHTFDDDGTYDVEFTIEDEDGNEESDTLRVRVGDGDNDDDGDQYYYSNPIYGTPYQPYYYPYSYNIVPQYNYQYYTPTYQTCSVYSPCPTYGGTYYWR